MLWVSFLRDFMKRTWAEISLDNIEHNFKVIKNSVNNSMICCVIKADGYGHGAVQIAKLYEKLGADWFSVSNIEEALELRCNGITKPILILGYTPCSCANLLAKNNISQACYSYDYATMLSKYAVEKDVTVNIHLKLDTGMSRIGLMCQEFDRDNNSIAIAEKICTLPNLSPQGVFTHFAVSDEGNHGKDFTKKQFNSFIHTVNELEKRGITFEIKHCANSGAIIDYPETHLDMVRAGIILYGLSPSDKVNNKINLKPAMTLKSVVSMVKTISKGTTVSYGRTYTAENDVKIATVPIGYADGFIRSIAKDGYVCIKGKKAKILGRICMDQLLVDATNIEDLEIGEQVILFGDNLVDNKNSNIPTADDIAKWTSSINYDIVCMVSKRVPRKYIKNNIEINVVDHLLG